MNTITFDKLLLKTAFCCMASDGDIDKREVAQIKKMCEKSDLFKDFDFQNQINKLVERINNEGKRFIQYYFGLLESSELSTEEELTIIDFAIQTIYADEIVQYSEVKFFKNIRHRLKVSDEKIMERFPDLEEFFLEDDIKTDFSIEKLTNQYLEIANIPQFDKIDLPIYNK